MISARGLRVSLHDRTVLEDVCFDIERGEIVGLIGPPEAGKTILLKTIASLIEPDAGEVWADGERVDGLADPAPWQSRIGMAFQNDALFDALSVFDNVAFPLRRRRMNESTVRTRVETRLDDVGLHDAAPKRPSDISGGMRKRVGIARATVIGPELGLFDDPIAGLDPVTGGRILDLIVSLTEALDIAAVVISNDLPVLLPICKRVVMLNAGRVVYDGSPDQLMASPRPEVVQFVTGSDEGPL